MNIDVKKWNPANWLPQTQSADAVHSSRQGKDA